jgi:Flp pilus assembly protein TadD
VQWALYYPPVIDFKSLPRTGLPPALQRVLDAYGRDDLAAALEALDRVPEVERTALFSHLQAGLLLTVGRVEEARPVLAAALQRDPKDATAKAQQALIALARNEPVPALAQARAAAASDPRSAAAQIALSYVHQARFELERALKHSRRAVALDSHNALAQVRLAELELSLGHLKAGERAARRALRLNPHQARARTLLGFAELLQIDTDQALAHFDQAIAQDAADPLSRFGRGLARIRQGKLREGTAELELAASLDPNDALIRSYLGKAYYEQKRSKPAQSELDIAKGLDPKDPTPYFYDAIQQQTENRPVEALHSLQQAIERNDNRAVYRSRQMLDEDLAARSAGLGRIYQDLGFEQRALVEGWKSVSSSPQDYSGHRLLADSYRKLRRQEVARVSELLQAQLLQPLNVTPIPPTLAESNLLVLDISGPARFSFNEFNPAFARNRFALQTFGLVGSLDTFSDEIVQSGLKDNLSYSLGQYHYQTNGYRPNNDLRQDIYDAFIQARLAPSLSIQGELRYRENAFGYLQQRFDLQDFDPTERNRNRAVSARAGLHWAVDEAKDLLASFVHSKTSRRIFFEFPGAANTIAATDEADSGELQYQQRGQFWSTIVGGGYLSSDRRDTSEASSAGEVNVTSRHRTITYGNAYAYNYFHWGQNLTLTAGLSVDAYDQENFDRRRINPKLGLFWRVTPSTTIRAAGFTTLKRPFASDQTIEPTQVAGFNQFFDDINGANTQRYGVGIDQVFAAGFYGGVESSWRRISYPSFKGGILNEKKEVDEWLQRAYVNWAPTNTLAVSLEYFYENTDRQQKRLTIDQPRRAVTHTVPLTVGYFDPSGFFARGILTVVDQDVQTSPGSATESDTFCLLDASIGFRLPRRFGIVSFGARNLLDQDFSFLDAESVLQDIPRTPRYVPERTFFGQVTLAF